MPVGDSVVARIWCDVGGTKLGVNENKSSLKNDTEYIHVATTKLQQLLHRLKLFGMER